MFNHQSPAPARRPTVRLLLALATLLALPEAAEAAGTRFVALNGSDANDCLRPTPCRTLQRGVNLSPAGGEVIVLGSGSYGNSLAIAKSITISADGVTATLGIPGTITINNAAAIVALRGLHLQGVGAAGTSGVVVTAAGAVHIETCIVERFGGHGVLVSADTNLVVKDSIVRDNSGSGLFVNATGATLAVDNSRVVGNRNGYGIYARAAHSTITRTMISGNSIGIQQSGGLMNVWATTAAQNGGAGFAVAMGGTIILELSVARGNGTYGLRVFKSSSARISSSAFTNNPVGLRNEGALETRQNNTVQGNGTDVVGPLTGISGT